MFAVQCSAPGTGNRKLGGVELREGTTSNCVIAKLSRKHTNEESESYSSIGGYSGKAGGYM